MKAWFYLFALTATTVSWDQIRIAIIQEHREEFAISGTSTPVIKPSDCTPNNLKVFRNGLLQTSPGDYTWDATNCEVKPTVSVDKDIFILIFN